MCVCVILTHTDSLITVYSSKPISAPSTVVPTKFCVTLAGPVKEAQRPSFPIVPSVVRVLRAVWPPINDDWHTPATPGPHSTFIVGQASGRWTAGGTTQDLGCHTFAWELRLGDRDVHAERKHTLPHPVYMQVLFKHRTLDLGFKHYILRAKHCMVSVSFTLSMLYHIALTLKTHITG